MAHLKNGILLTNMHMAHGEPVSDNFDQISVVGMPLYLAGHTCPDITNTLNCVTKYIFCPKLVDKHSLKQI